ncbi:helix-turn-helix protein [Pseudorhodoferax soli]|uniref:Helix-turn-helix protein n=1 Tax=Pseudorhodoferax soli TaxID=545864 RepID=A0A368XCZ6_9BURK|nr:helix-turn-helix protein [Pseudorhodoferax soli]
MRSHQDPALLRAFATELRARRNAAGLSQEGLAFQSGLNRTFIAKLELADTSPSITTLFRIAEGLRTDVGELMSAVAKRLRKERPASGKAAT